MNYALYWISLLAVCLAFGCGPRPESTIEVYHAGSLSVPFRMLESAFEAQHPQVDVRRQAHGSAMAIRQVTDLGKRADIVASADYRLIDRLMIQSPGNWASWNLCFARNAMCIAHAEDSPEITTDNWADAVTKGDVRVGISNPNQDPCGYRSLMVLCLAQEQLGKTAVFDDLILKNSDIRVQRTRGRSVICVPGSVSFRGSLVVRPKEVDLVALLQANAIDYLFIYRSVAVQHGLAFIELPPQVNLSSPDLQELYGSVSVRLFADRPDASVEIPGGPIVYGITIPSTVRYPERAEDFLRLLVSQEGRNILRKCGMEPLWPPVYSDASSGVALPF